MRREMDLFFKFPPPVVIYLPVIGLTVFKDIPFCRYVIEIGIPFLAFAPVRILRVFVYCSEVGKIYVTIVRLLESLSIEYRLIKTKVITVANQNKDKYCMEPIALKRGKTLVTNSQLAFISFISHWLQGCLEFWRPTTERSETKPKNHGLLSALNRSFHQRLLHFPLGAREPLLTFPKGGLSFHSLRAVLPFQWNPSPSLKKSAKKKIHIVGTLRKTLRVRLTNGPANANINFFLAVVFSEFFAWWNSPKRRDYSWSVFFSVVRLTHLSYLHFRYFSSFWFFSPVTTTSSTYWQSSCVSRCWMTSVFSLVYSVSCADGACVQVVVMRQVSVSNTAYRKIVGQSIMRFSDFPALSTSLLQAFEIVYS